LKPEDRFWLGSDQSVPIAKTTLPRTPIATLRFATMLPTEEEMRDTRWHALFEAVGYNLGHFGTDVQYFESPVPGEPDKDDPDRENIPTKHQGGGTMMMTTTIVGIVAKERVASVDGSGEHCHYSWLVRRCGILPPEVPRDLHTWRWNSHFVTTTASMKYKHLALFCS
jgi:hypothetical protein